MLWCPAKDINTRTPPPLLAKFVMHVRLPLWLVAPSNPALESLLWRFVKVTDTHENIGDYLTKEYAHYYLLNGRGLVMKDSKIDLFVEFYALAELGTSTMFNP